jgi:hypothetical protein
MTNEPPEIPQQSTPDEPQKRDLLDEFIRASGFGPPPKVCRKLEQPLPGNEQNIVGRYIEAAGFGLQKRRN